MTARNEPSRRDPDPGFDEVGTVILPEQQEAIDALVRGEIPGQVEIDGEADGGDD